MRNRSRNYYRNNILLLIKKKFKHFIKYKLTPSGLGIWDRRIVILT